MKQISDLDKAKESLSNCVYHSKINAKITETSQPIDLGPNFKELKKCGRACIAVNRDTPLTISVTDTFTKLQNQGRLVLTAGKRGALIDCICAAPDMINKSFSSEFLTKSFVDTGMLDHATRIVPYL